MSLLILKPHSSYETYIQAANVFSDYYKRITGFRWQNSFQSKQQKGCPSYRQPLIFLMLSFQSGTHNFWKYLTDPLFPAG